MRMFPLVPLITVGGTIVLILGAPLRAETWTTEFQIDKQDLASSGRNPYFILEPGRYLVLREGNVKLTITVLTETKMVDGVETRVVEERESRAGKPSEISRNYFAISKRTNDVFYFGEDVDIYKGGKVISHSGAWLSGVNGARFGLFIPGQPSVNARYYQEVAPGVAMDRVEIISLTYTVRTPAGELKNCLKVKETTPLEAGVTDYKYYAPGIGMVQDGALKLVKSGTA